MSKGAGLDSVLAQYLGEDGSGSFSLDWVPDLVPDGGQPVELVLVFESPHTTELAVRFPVAGPTGQRALRFLRPDVPDFDSLGRLIKQRHDDGDYRIAILNASPVPLQREAFGSGTAPGLAEGQWTVLGQLRANLMRPTKAAPRSTMAAAIAELKSNLGQRARAMNTIESCVLVPFGEAARTATSEISGLQVLAEKVPHPASPRWSTLVRDGDPALEHVRQAFGGAVEELADRESR